MDRSHLLRPLWITILLALFSPPVSAKSLSPVLEELLHFHPGWVSKAVTSHDQWGHNGDGEGKPYHTVVENKATYWQLYHGIGEGRILRIWLTLRENQMDRLEQEFIVRLDGKEVYRGSARNFFEGRGPWKSPLVKGFQESSGAFLSYVPFPYAREAQILWKAQPAYFQVTAREGAGSSQGPTAKQVEEFSSEKWWEESLSPSKAQSFKTQGKSSIALVEGPALISRFTLKVDQGDVGSLQVKIGNEPPVPAAFFFGSTANLSFSNSLHWGDGQGLFKSRLPIPVQLGETVEILSVEGTQVSGTATFDFSQFDENRDSKVKLFTNFNEVKAQGKAGTLEVMKSDAALQMVSLVEEINGGKDGDRLFLEGDEMIRSDSMEYPLTHGTGTEDYFNGGWYFLGAHSNPMAGMPRFDVINPENSWKNASFILGLFRHHVLDPLVSRSGFRFGFESGEIGEYTPVKYRFLSLGYRFDEVKKLGSVTTESEKLGYRDSPGSARSNRALGYTMMSSIDAEYAYPSRLSRVNSHRGITEWSVECPKNGKPDGAFVTRSFDAAHATQRALLKINGREAGYLASTETNPSRRLAENGIWVDLKPWDCNSGRMNLEFWAWNSPDVWTEVSYRVDFYDIGTRNPSFVTGPKTHLVDTSQVDGKPYYMNDHTFVRGFDWNWNLVGIFNHEPYSASSEKQFSLSTSSTQNSREWKSGEFKLESTRYYNAEVDSGESVVWAPHIIREGNTFYMYYHSGGMMNAHISLATSQDLKHWKRHWILFNDFCTARDPMVKKIGDLFVMYYTRCNSALDQRSGVAYRVSRDLIHWSEPEMAFVWWDKPKLNNSGYTESPFVFERNGWFYLSVTAYPDAYDATYLFRSRSPFHFTAEPVMQFSSHAGEWIPEWEDDWGRFKGPLKLSHAGAGQSGVWAMDVEFVVE